MSARPKFESVPAYLAALDPARAKVLKQVLSMARKAVPDGEPVISYGIPALKKERVFIYCAAFKSHIGVFPPVRGDAKLKAALKPYSNAKGNLSFPLSEPIPAALIARVAKALAKEYGQASSSAPSKRKGKGGRAG